MSSADANAARRLTFLEPLPSHSPSSGPRPLPNISPSPPKGVAEDVGELENFALLDSLSGHGPLQHTPGPPKVPHDVESYDASFITRGREDHSSSHATRARAEDRASPHRHRNDERDALPSGQGRTPPVSIGARRLYSPATPASARSYRPKGPGRFYTPARGESAEGSSGAHGRRDRSPAANRSSPHSPEALAAAARIAAEVASPSHVEFYAGSPTKTPSSTHSQNTRQNRSPPRAPSPAAHVDAVPGARPPSPAGSPAAPRASAPFPAAHVNGSPAAPRASARKKASTPSSSKTSHARARSGPHATRSTPSSSKKSSAHKSVRKAGGADEARVPAQGAEDSKKKKKTVSHRPLPPPPESKSSHAGDENIEDYRSLHEMSTELGVLFEDGLLADVLFCFETGEGVPAHRSIVVARSAYFRGLLMERHGRVGSDGMQRITVRGTPAAVFREVLSYLYKGTVGDLPDIHFALDLLSAAYDFDISSLKNICEDAVIAALCVENAGSILRRLDTLGSANTSVVTSFITNNLRSVCGQGNFRSLPPSLLLRVLDNIAER